MPVTSNLKSIRKHYIDLTLPRAPKPDEEAFVLRIARENARLVEIELSANDLEQFLRCTGSSLSRITSGALGSKQPSGFLGSPTPADSDEANRLLRLP